MSVAKARSDPRLLNLAILWLSAQHAKLCVASPPLLHLVMREEVTSIQKPEVIISKDTVKCNSSNIKKKWKKNVP
jgi:hypothetical protein